MLDKKRIRNDATRVLKAIQWAGDQSDEEIAKAIDDVVKLVGINRAYTLRGMLPERLDAEQYDPEAVSEDQYGYDTMVNTTTIYMLKSYETSDIPESTDGSSRAHRSKSKGGSQPPQDDNDDDEPSFTVIVQGLAVLGARVSLHLATFFIPDKLSKLAESLAYGAGDLTSRVIGGLVATDMVGLGISTAVGVYTARAGERINYRPLQSHGILFVGGVAFSYIPYIDFEAETKQSLLSVSNTAKTVSGATTLVRNSAALFSPGTPTGLRVLAFLNVARKVVMQEWVYGRQDFPETQQELSFFMFEMSLNVVDNIITAEHAKDLIYSRYGAFLRPRSSTNSYGDALLPPPTPPPPPSVVVTLSEPVSSKRSANFDDSTTTLKRQRTFAVPDVIVRSFTAVVQPSVVRDYTPLETGVVRKTNPLQQTPAAVQPQANAESRLHTEHILPGWKPRHARRSDDFLRRVLTPEMGQLTPEQLRQNLVTGFIATTDSAGLEERRPRNRGSEEFFRRVLPPETPRPNMMNEYIYDWKHEKKQQATADDVLKALVDTYGYDRVAAVEEILVQAKRKSRVEPTVETSVEPAVESLVEPYPMVETSVEPSVEPYPMVETSVEPSVEPDPKDFSIEFMFGGGDLASLITEQTIPRPFKSFNDLGAAMVSAVKGDAKRYKAKNSGKPYAIEPQVVQDVPIGKPIINVIKEGREAQLRLTHSLHSGFERFLDTEKTHEEEYKQEDRKRDTDEAILERMMTHIARLLYKKVKGEVSAPFVNLWKLTQPLRRADTYYYFLENVLKPAARTTHKFVIVPASDAAYYVDDFLHRGETMEDLDKELDWIDTGFVKSLGDLYTWAQSVDDDVSSGDMRGFDHHSKATTNTKGVIGSLIDSGQIGIDLDLSPDVEIKDIASIQTVLGGGEPDVPLKPILAAGVETWIRDTHVDPGLEHLSGQVVFNPVHMYTDPLVNFASISDQGPPVETLATYKPIPRVPIPRPVEVYDAQVVFKQAVLPKDPLLNFASISDQGPKQAQDQATDQGPKVDQETSTETKVVTPNTQKETRDKTIPTVVNVEKKDPLVLQIQPVVDDSVEKAIERDKSIRANLRPFLAMAGTDSFNEQGSAESDRLKASNLMMGQLPQRHIGTAVSNPLQFGQMVQAGVRYSGDLDETPVYYMGGSLTEGDELYGTVRDRMPDVPMSISRTSKIFQS